MGLFLNKSYLTIMQKLTGKGKNTVFSITTAPVKVIQYRAGRL